MVCEVENDRIRYFYETLERHLKYQGYDISQAKCSQGRDITNGKNRGQISFWISDFDEISSNYKAQKIKTDFNKVFGGFAYRIERVRFEGRGRIALFTNMFM